MHERTLRAAGLLLALASVAVPARAGDWPQWRGPDGNSVSDEKGLISTWSKTTGQNLIWRLDWVGRSTPAVFDGRVCASGRTDLRYEIMYRREGDTAWKTLKAGLTDPIFVWDTTSVPNGTYVVKVVASDQASNTPGAALDGELESSAFDIDNAPPAITVTGSRASGGKTTISFDVRDEFSSIQKVEYSLDAQRWQVIYPKDGIFDSRLEQFDLTLDTAVAARGLIIRAYDAKNNSATARGDVPTSPAGK